MNVIKILREELLMEAKKFMFYIDNKGKKKKIERKKGLERIASGKLKPNFDDSGKMVPYTPKIAKKIKSGEGKYPAAAIPPAWEDVQISTKKHAKILAIGYEISLTTGQRILRRVYNPAFRAARDYQKHARTGSLVSKKGKAGRQKLLDRFAKAMKKGGEAAHAAGILYIAGVTGQRIGAVLSTKAGVRKYIDDKSKTLKSGKFAKKKILAGVIDTFALATLLAKHIKVSGSTTIFKYAGKLGEKQHHKINDSNIATFYKKIMKGLKPKDSLHPANTYMKAYKLLKKTTKGKVKIKDFRTAVAHMDGETFKAQYIAKYGAPQTPKEKKAAIKWIIEQIAKKLGNKPGEVKKSYINPKTIKFDDDV